MKKKLVTFDEFLNESCSPKEQVSIQNFDKFMKTFLTDPMGSLGEDLSESIVLEKHREGNRLVDFLNEKSIFEGLEFETFTEEEKWQLEDAMWEGVLFYTTNSETLNESELYEGIWSSIVGSVGALAEKGKKALDWAMKTLGNIGSLLKGIGEYIAAFFAKVVELGTKTAKQLLGSITGPIEKKFENRQKKFSEDAVKTEGKQYQETAEWISKSVESLMKKGEKDAMSAAQDAAGSEDEEKEKLIDGIKNKMIDNAEKKVKENNDIAKYTRVINEIRKSSEIDFSDLVIASEIAAKSKTLDEGSTEKDLLTDDFLLELFGWEKKKEAEKQDPTVDENPDDKTKSMIAKAVKGLSTVVSIFVSGIVWFFEKAIEYLLREFAFPTLSAWVAKCGGPGTFKFAITAGVMAILLATIAEFGLDILKSATGTDALDGILKMVHGLNPLHIVEHALHIPGGAYVAKGIAVVWCAYQAFNHIKHLLHEDHEKGHGAEGGHGHGH
jgi:hypothetical protein